MKEKVARFIFSIYNRGKYEEFKRQTIAYMRYKKITEQQVHRRYSYQHAWKDTDWVDAVGKVREPLYPVDKRQYIHFFVEYCLSIV